MPVLASTLPHGISSRRRKEPEKRSAQTLQSPQVVLKSLVEHDVSDQSASNIDKICELVDEYPVEDVAAVLEFAARLILDPDTSTEGYRVIATLAQYNEFTRLDRYEFFLKIVRQIPAKHSVALQSCLLSCLTSRGRVIEGFEPLIPNFLPRLVEEGLTRKPDEHLEKTFANGMGVGVDSKSQAPLDLVCNIIKFNASFLGDMDTVSIIQSLFEARSRVCEANIPKAIEILDALLVYSNIPSDAVVPLTRTLCFWIGAQIVDPDAKRQAKIQKSFFWLLSTHLKDLTAKSLLETLEDDVQQAAGAALVLLPTFTDIKIRKYVELDLGALLEVLSRPISGDITSKSSHAWIRLGLLEGLLQDQYMQQKLLAEEDWAHLRDTIIRNANQPYEEDPGVTDHGISSTIRDMGSIDLRVKRVQNIITILEHFQGISLQQSRKLRGIALALAPFLTDQQAKKLIQAYEPSSFRIYVGRWPKEFQDLARHFISNTSCDLSLRQRALSVVNSAWRTGQELGERQAIEVCENTVLEVLRHETNHTFRGNLVHCLVNFVSAEGVSEEFYNGVVNAIVASARTECDHDMIDKDVLNERPASPELLMKAAADTFTGDDTPYMLPDAGLVVLLMRASVDHLRRSQFLYQEILNLIAWQQRLADPEAMIMLLRGLFRIRSDIDHCIFFIPSPEGESLAAALHRNSDAPLIASRRGSQYSGLSAPRMPIWKYGDINGLPESPPNSISLVLRSESEEDRELDCSLDMTKWLTTIIDLIQHDCDWEVYSYIIVHLGPQLANQSLFIEAVEQIKQLAKIICIQIQEDNVMKPPEASNLKQGDVAFCLVNILTTLIGYHKHFDRKLCELMVSTLIRGLTAWDRTTVPCIHALTLCCYELPVSLSRDLVRIIDQMSTIVTKSEAAIHVLEFLAGMSRLEFLTSRFHGDEIRVVLGVCFSYISYARGKRFDDAQQRVKSSTSTTRPIPVPETAGPSTEDIPQYVFAISYHVITFWFLALRHEDRIKQLPWVEQRLLSRDQAGNLADEGLVTLDHLWRVTKGNGLANPLLHESNQIPVSPIETVRRTWVSEYCIVAITCHAEGGEAEVIERRASGTDGSRFPHLGQDPDAIFRERFSQGIDGPFRNIANGKPELLPISEASSRALRMFDNTNPADFFKSGVIYVGEAQTDESTILANTMGSPDYDLFIQGLGDRISLVNCRSNVAGLDTSGTLLDGTSTRQHQDSITTLNYHITTMMPTNRDRDPQCTFKKRHIGNDFVNIIFNNSGRPFDFNTFPSAFNYVYIIVTPEARQTFIQTRTRLRDPGWFDASWFKVQVQTREDFPDISSSAETKVVSGEVLAAYVRNLVLNAEVFCRVWANKDNGGEYPSTWRYRLGQIRQLYERFGRNKSLVH
ncbi:hypothetical protein MBLNU459_g5190t1 [Dothideomycetes sp. NU459]